MSQVTECQIKNIVNDFKCAIEEFLCNDKEQLTINGSERAKEFRIAHYLQNIINNKKDVYGDNFVVDCEYNRIAIINGDGEFYTDSKRITKKDGSHTTFTPDIIVHKRNSDEYNLLVCEMKNQNDDEYDKEKVDFCLKNNQYVYKVGFCLNINNLKLENYFSYIRKI